MHRREIFLLTSTGIAHRSASKVVEVTHETWCGVRPAGYVVHTVDGHEYVGPKCRKCFRAQETPQQAETEASGA